MPSFVNDPCLFWSSFDTAGIVTYSCQSLIAEYLGVHHTKATSQLVMLESPHAILSTPQPLGLSVWRIASLSDVEQICGVLPEATTGTASPVQLLFVEAEWNEYIPILMEAGAQIIATELTLLRHAIDCAVRTSKISDQGDHPLTKGISDRLPWPDN